jgi:hypothetical protein
VDQVGQEAADGTLAPLLIYSQRYKGASGKHWCDAAAEMLGPEVVDRVFGDRAGSVLPLCNATGTSGAAYCGRVAHLIPCEGFVLVTDPAGELLYSRP